ncbi:MAG: hypothetical protein EOL88_06975 [Bacteroidia bacterium]|jgi:hypothetical protein|nr:hypothetical protein [Bacteroidales bacterium]MDD3962142.1 hypothetical protein [Bacteroidales bacterium]MDY0287066.1 hypothetical protein [Bacteroidales bacterium]NCD41818.1 hypothetical protein [Bacteroidia bacterium]HPG11694.1 hypothetical protein [Chitinophagaceae bacterium]
MSLKYEYNVFTGTFDLVNQETGPIPGDNYRSNQVIISEVGGSVVFSTPLPSGSYTINARLFTENGEGGFEITNVTVNGFEVINPTGAGIIEYQCLLNN